MGPHGRKLYPTPCGAASFHRRHPMAHSVATVPPPAMTRAPTINRIHVRTDRVRRIGRGMGHLPGWLRTMGCCQNCVQVRPTPGSRTRQPAAMTDDRGRRTRIAAAEPIANMPAYRNGSQDVPVCMGLDAARIKGSNFPTLTAPPSLLGGPHDSALPAAKRLTRPRRACSVERMIENARRQWQITRSTEQARRGREHARMFAVVQNHLHHRASSVGSIAVRSRLG